MPGDVVLSARDLGKKYVIRNHFERERYTALRDVISRSISRMTQATKDVFRHRDSAEIGKEDFWALRNINFDVKRGDVVGIIGRNGAGKSTLLKIVSRITEPSEGRVEIRGRVASLLEVGTGFHPELTGRENVFLNGAILGMSRSEIRQKFDQIVAFAEIERFLDTPVKRYSSGMYVRLAFAVAAHLDPDILIIDEVLAVGDSRFQEKCLALMQQTARSGRTVVFVSHNMAAVSALCNRIIALNSGTLWADGGLSVISSYFNSLASNTNALFLKNRQIPSTQRFWLTNVTLSDALGRSITIATTGGTLTIAFHYRIRSSNEHPEFAFTVYSALGAPVLYFDTSYSMNRDRELTGNSAGVARCRIPRLPLVAGEYWLNVLIHHKGDYVDHVSRAARIVVDRGDYYGTGRMPPEENAAVLIEHSWSIDAHESD